MTPGSDSVGAESDDPPNLVLQDYLCFCGLCAYFPALDLQVLRLRWWRSAGILHPHTPHH